MPEKKQPLPDHMFPDDVMLEKKHKQGAVHVCKIIAGV